MYDVQLSNGHATSRHGRILKRDLTDNVALAEDCEHSVSNSPGFAWSMGRDDMIIGNNLSVILTDL